MEGWRQIDGDIEQFEGGEDQVCRLLVGMYRLPKEELWESLAIGFDVKRMLINLRGRLRDRLMAYTQHVRESTPLLAVGTDWESLEQAIEEINPLCVINLCVINPEERQDGAQIVCSMGLFRG